MHLDLTAHVGTRWRGGRGRRLPFKLDQDHLLPDSSENVDLGISGIQHLVKGRGSVHVKSLRE